MDTLHALLDAGLHERDRTGAPVCYRFLGPEDNLEAVTLMLHEAYRPLAEAGMRYVASYQDVETTKRRIEGGETIVATSADDIVGIITLRGPGGGRRAAHYMRPDVAMFGQFGVHPSFQRRGIGSRLLELVEARAREKGATEIALDTSEHAEDLVSLYRSRGFGVVEYVQWEVTNYRSVILSKALGGGPPGSAAARERPEP